jgi:hypothetical protein
LRSNPSGKCSYERPTRGTVCGTMRSMCSADAGCLAINYQVFLLSRVGRPEAWQSRKPQSRSASPSTSPAPTSGTAFERRGNTLRKKDFDLEVEARIYLRLSYMCHIGSTAASQHILCVTSPCASIFNKVVVLGSVGSGDRTMLDASCHHPLGGCSWVEIWTATWPTLHHTRP